MTDQNSGLFWFCSLPEKSENSLHSIFTARHLNFSYAVQPFIVSCSKSCNAAKLFMVAVSNVFHPFSSRAFCRSNGKQKSISIVFRMIGHIYKYLYDWRNQAGT